MAERRSGDELVVGWTSAAAGEEEGALAALDMARQRREGELVKVERAGGGARQGDGGQQRRRRS